MCRKVSYNTNVYILQPVEYKFNFPDLPSTFFPQPTFIADASLAGHGAFSGVTYERELQPGRRRLELLEQIRKGDPDDEAILGGDVDVHDEVLGRDGPEEEVEKASGQPQGLGAGARQLDVVSGGDGASYSPDAALHRLVLGSQM